MKMKVLVLATMLFLVTAPAFAAEVDGKWAGTVAGPGGDTPVAFTFKADGTKLTGSTTGLDGAEIQIADGKIDGNNITFKLTYDFGGMPFELSYKGVVSAEEIKLTADFAGMPFEFVLKKPKA